LVGHAPCQNAVCCPSTRRWPLYRPSGPEPDCGQTSVTPRGAPPGTAPTGPLPGKLPRLWVADHVTDRRRTVLSAASAVARPLGFPPKGACSPPSRHDGVRYRLCGEGGRSCSPGSLRQFLPVIRSRGSLHNTADLPSDARARLKSGAAVSRSALFGSSVQSCSAAGRKPQGVDHLPAPLTLRRRRAIGYLWR